MLHNSVKVTIFSCLACGRWSANAERCCGRPMRAGAVPVAVEPGLLNAGGQLRDARNRIHLRDGLLAMRELERELLERELLGRELRERREATTAGSEESGDR